MISFGLAVFLLIITPGPGVLSTAGVGAAFGWHRGLFYIAGLCLGTLKNFLVPSNQANNCRYCIEKLEHQEGPAAIYYGP